MKLIEQISEKLRNSMDIEHLEIIDDSHLHIGHREATADKLHITINIQSKELSNLNRLQQHRKIYNALGTHVSKNLHAIRIKVM